MSPEIPGTGMERSHETMLRARDYQTEMFERSLEGNAIVAMDTGSGKTQIAVLRIMAELERCSMEKLIWFLAPTVALCTQQHAFICSQLPAVRTRLLIGSDNVDRWSEQRIWDIALDSVRIVVSTHAVLADALGHGFVNMKHLALIVFDEAHHCARGHPANKIMQNFYHPLKQEEGTIAVPHILGLSASPILRSKISELQTIESNLDAISITPRFHREEMFKFVHRPALHRLEYTPYDEDKGAPLSEALLRLQCIRSEVCVEQSLSTMTLNSDSASLGSLWTSSQRRSDTWKDQLDKFCRKAEHIYKELGPWAADYFVFESIAALKKSADDCSDFLDGCRDKTKTSLLKILDQDGLSRKTEDAGGVDLLISAKVQCLIDFLCEQNHCDCSGLLFVRQRATVSVLCTLLSIHPKTKERFQCATFVGLSTNAYRKYTLSELFDLKAQRDTLTEFRARRKNLIIATDVLEEGIDVAACNLVVCFDPPQNLKSFIQRRGRARKEQSSFAIMVAQGDKLSRIDAWQVLEQELIREYQSDARRLQNVLALENIEEAIEERLEVASTGALMTPESAMAHLHHFCALLPHQPYVDLRPAFSFTYHPVTNLITSTVVLPNCVKASLRSTRGRKEWRTERVAMKDAAFYAYKALFEEGLLNDNLLPLTHESVIAEHQLDEVPAVIEASAQFDPWKALARSWTSPNLHRIQVIVQEIGKGTENNLSMNLTVPSVIPPVPPFLLYWDEKTTFRICLGEPGGPALIEPDNLQILREITHILDRSTHSDSTATAQTDFIAPFSPDIPDGKLAIWVAANRGRCEALPFREQASAPRGFVRTPLRYNAPYHFHGWRNLHSEQADAALEVVCLRLPKRRNFLLPATLSKHSMFSEEILRSSKLEAFPAEHCTIDLLPTNLARFSLFIPAILQQIEVFSIAHRVRTSVLKDVHIEDIRHVVTAICAPSAQWNVNYQRYEFFGDAILKFVVSWQLFCEHGNWPEGYLSVRRNRIVSNASLAGAALKAGLDAFIITDLGKGRKWTPPLISEALSRSDEKRSMSAKVFADVVEALIGGAFFDGGIRLARTCIHTFLPIVRIDPPEFNPSGGDPTIAIIDAELVIGYQFRSKGLLVEALTHPSQERDRSTESYQRLEFLGDAVLDYLIVSLLAEQKREHSQGQMTHIKAALVNADILGFLCLESSHKREVCSVEERPAGIFTEKIDVEEIQLWKFIRHHSRDIANAQRRCLARYGVVKRDIRHLLGTNASYPWLPFARLNVEKFYSDTIESVLGAIFVDQKGELKECQRFIERIGLAAYARRVMLEDINVLHPKAIVEQSSGSAEVRYTIEGEEGETCMYRCSVAVDGVKIVHVEGCLTQNEAVVAAADAASKLLSGPK